MIITSTANENVKKLRALLRDVKYRKEMREFVVEGATIVGDMPKHRIKRLFIKASEEEKYSEFAKKYDTYILSDGVFGSVADTKTPSGIIAVSDYPKTDNKIAGELCVLLCGLSDAGNVGTIIRTACARGVETVICAECADPFSPKAVRASMGGIFGVKVIITDIETAVSLIDGYKLVALDMGGKSIYGYKRNEKTVLAVGNEAHGIPTKIRERANDVLSIPMREGGVESLNAAVAAGIAMYSI